MQQQPWTARRTGWRVPTKMTLTLIARDIRKSLSYFESLASNSIPSEDVLSGNGIREGDGS
jgi:hypothetical protein